MDKYRMGTDEIIVDGAYLYTGAGRYAKTILVEFIRGGFPSVWVRKGLKGSIPFGEGGWIRVKRVL